MTTNAGALARGDGRDWRAVDQSWDRRAVDFATLSEPANCRDAPAAGRRAARSAAGRRVWGWAAHDRGDYDAAEPFYLRSLDINERIGDQPGIATSYANLGSRQALCDPVAPRRSPGHGRSGDPQEHALLCREGAVARSRHLARAHIPAVQCGRQDRWIPGLPLGEAPRDHRQQRPARPGCPIPCHPVSLPDRTDPVSEARFTTLPGTRKALSLVGKGPDLRKLVAGAGFEPATSGL